LSNCVLPGLASLELNDNSISGLVFGGNIAEPIFSAVVNGNKSRFKLVEVVPECPLKTTFK